MKLDLAVVNGVAYVEGAFCKCDIGVKDEKFAVIAEPGGLPEAERVIDAKGRYVIPGAIDTHVHIREPGHNERETFETGTRAAAAGGVTLIMEHPISCPPQYNKEILDNRIRLCDAQSLVDFAFFGAAGGRFPEEITKIAKEGICAFKTFLHEPPEGRDAEFIGLTMANDAEIYRGMKEVAKTGLYLASHAENNDMIQAEIKRLRAEGRVDPAAHCESRPPISEFSTVQKMILFAKETGAKLELVHISTPEAMEMAKQAKREGQDVVLETCPHYLLLDESALPKFGPFAKCNPPLRSRETVEKLWEYVVDGTVDFIGSDHGPFQLCEKETGYDDIFKAPAGFPGIDLRLPLMLNEAHKGRLSLERVVELLCVNPARIFNFFPQKGVIRPGADADLVIFDMERESTVDWHKSYCKSANTARAYDGWKLHGVLDYTVMRGRVVMEEGVVDEKAAGYGKLVKPVKA